MVTVRHGNIDLRPDPQPMKARELDDKLHDAMQTGTGSGRASSPIVILTPQGQPYYILDCYYDERSGVYVITPGMLAQ